MGLFEGLDNESFQITRPDSRYFTNGETDEVTFRLLNKSEILQIRRLPVLMTFPNQQDREVAELPKRFKLTRVSLMRAKLLEVILMGV